MAAQYKMIPLTQSQIALISYGLTGAVQLHQDFLMHQDWSEGIRADEKKRVEKNHADLKKAAATFARKITPKRRHT